MTATQSRGDNLLARKLEDVLRIESQTATKLELAYMKKKRRNIHIALEEINFIWCTKEIEKFRGLWNEGYDIWKIAEHLGRSVHDVVMLVYDQHLLGKIETRKGAIFGWQPNSSE